MGKISENSVKVLNYLKENHGTKMTSQEVAAALELTVAQVNGVFTALSNKGLGYREEAMVTGAKEISFLSITEAGKAADVSELSDNAKKVMDYFKTVEGEQITTDDAASALDMDKRKFTGTFNALVRKDFCARTPVQVEAEVPVKYLVLTDEGLAFEVSAD